MKKIIVLIAIAFAFLSCEKENEPQPQPTDQACMQCQDTVTGQLTPEMCDDTLTIRVWMEWYQFQNVNDSTHWKCKKYQH